MDKVDKGLTPVPSRINPTLYEIVWRGGAGKVPKELAGLWGKRVAVEKIEEYNKSKT